MCQTRDASASDVCESVLRQFPSRFLFRYFFLCPPCLHSACLSDDEVLRPSCHFHQLLPLFTSLGVNGEYSGLKNSFRTRRDKASNEYIRSCLFVLSCPSYFLIQARNGVYKYTGMWQSLILVGKEEGRRGLYAGMGTHVARVVSTAYLELPRLTALEQAVILHLRKV